MSIGTTNLAIEKIRMMKRYAPELLELDPDERQDRIDEMIIVGLRTMCQPVVGHPNVLAWFDRDDGDELGIAGIIAREGAEGSGAVARYLDTLPHDRRVVVSMVVNTKLAEMLERRGFQLRHRFLDIGGGSFVACHIRKAGR